MFLEGVAMERACGQIQMSGIGGYGTKIDTEGRVGLIIYHPRRDNGSHYILQFWGMRLKGSQRKPRSIRWGVKQGARKRYGACPPSLIIRRGRQCEISDRSFRCDTIRKEILDDR